MSFYITVNKIYHQEYIIRGFYELQEGPQCDTIPHGTFDGPFKGDRICKKMYVLEALFL